MVKPMKIKGERGTYCEIGAPVHKMLGIFDENGEFEITDKADIELYKNVMKSANIKPAKSSKKPTDAMNKNELVAEVVKLYPGDALGELMALRSVADLSKLTKSQLYDIIVQKEAANVSSDG